LLRKKEEPSPGGRLSLSVRRVVFPTYKKKREGEILVPQNASVEKKEKTGRTRFFPFWSRDQIAISAAGDKEKEKEDGRSKLMHKSKQSSVCVQREEDAANALKLEIRCYLGGGRKKKKKGDM